MTQASLLTNDGEDWPKSTGQYCTLSRYRKLFPHKFTQSGNSRQGALHPASQTWISHKALLSPSKDSLWLMSSTSHNLDLILPASMCLRCNGSTDPIVLCNIWVPGDSRFQSPQWSGPTLHICSHPPQPYLFKWLEEGCKESNRQGPLESWSHNPSPCNGMRKNTKTIKFQEPLEDIRNQRPTLPSDTQLRPTLRTPTPSGPNPSSAEATDPHTAVGQDIVALKWVFPCCFNTIGNMPRTYTIRTNPSIFPVQHTRRKVPIEYWDQKADLRWHGHIQNHHPGHPAYWVGIFLNISPQAWWISSYMPWPQGCE